MNRICGYCQQYKACQRCTGCKAISYCSIPCQNLDWGRHKFLCCSKVAKMDGYVMTLYTKHYWRHIGARHMGEDDYINTEHISLHGFYRDEDNPSVPIAYTDSIFWGLCSKEESLASSLESFSNSLKVWWKVQQTGDGVSNLFAFLRIVQNFVSAGRRVFFGGKRLVCYNLVNVVVKKKSYVPIIRCHRGVGEAYEFVADSLSPKHQVLLLWAEDGDSFFVDLTPYQYEIKEAWIDDNTMPHLVFKGPRLLLNGFCTAEETMGFINAAKRAQDSPVSLRTCFVDMVEDDSFLSVPYYERITFWDLGPFQKIGHPPPRSSFINVRPDSFCVGLNMGDSLHSAYYHRYPETVDIIRA